MMRRFWNFLTDSRYATIIGLIALAAIFYMGAELLELALIWALAALAATLLVAAIVWWVRRRIAKRQSDLLGDAIGQSAGPATAPAGGAGKSDAPQEEVDTIRDSMLKAIATIKGSKLGLMSGKRALYELPWYMIIGNPAAGKSSAIANSGLQFPFADGKIVQGVGGTRNCDWFFTTDGILLDTAGRYSVVDEHRAEWVGFLDLLKKYRKRAPINGIIIAVSIAELRGDDPDAGLNLARSLRKRVQDLIERLEVFAPVYVVFTKADLIAGFGEFFGMAERSERERVWGATMAYKRKISSQQLMTFFDQGFDELCDGLQEMSLANMGQQRRHMQPGVFTFPIEFLSIRAPVRAFIATLFEENPFQFKPVFRGFYFTSALQEGESVSASSHSVAQRFDLKLQPQEHEETHQQQGYFLLNLFRKVIFADKDLVAQYASPAKTRMRYAAFFAATAFVGLALAGWSWSYMNNHQLVANVQADLDQAIKVQQNRMDLQSRFQALEILQDRIEQLDSYHEHRPLSLGLGLYQGDLLDRKLREEYFAGVREVMLKPVGQSLESFLAEVNSGAAQLQPMAKPVTGAATDANASAAPVNNGATQFKDASPANAEDAYNALKTYLMLSDKSRAEAG